MYVKVTKYLMSRFIYYLRQSIIHRISKSLYSRLSLKLIIRLKWIFSLCTVYTFATAILLFLYAFSNLYKFYERRQYRLVIVAMIFRNISYNTYDMVIKVLHGECSDTFAILSSYCNWIPKKQIQYKCTNI